MGWDSSYDDLSATAVDDDAPKDRYSVQGEVGTVGPLKSYWDDVICLAKGILQLLWIYPYI